MGLVIKAQNDRMIGALSVGLKLLLLLSSALGAIPGQPGNGIIICRV